MLTDPFSMLPKIIPFHLPFFFLSNCTWKKIDSSWKHIKVLEWVDLTFLPSQWDFLWFLLSFWLRLWMIEPLKQSQRQEIPPLNLLKRLLLSGRYLEPPGCLSSDASTRAVLWLSFKHQQYTFTTWVLMLLAFLRQRVQHFGSLAPHRSWLEDCCWTANGITG